VSGAESCTQQNSFDLELDLDLDADDDEVLNPVDSDVNFFESVRETYRKNKSAVVWIFLLLGLLLLSEL